MEDKKIDFETEKTINAYDHDPILEGNPFLYTRIQEFRKNGVENEFNKKKTGLRLNLALTIIVLLLNATTLFFYFSSDKQSNARQQLLINLKEEFQIEQSQNEL